MERHAQVEVPSRVLKVAWMISFKNLVQWVTMWPTHSFHKHLCVIFLTSAIITSLLILKNSKNQNNPIRNSRNRTRPNIFHFPFEKKRNNKTGGEIIYILGLFELTTKWGKRPEGKDLRD